MQVKNKYNYKYNYYNLAAKSLELNFHKVKSIRKYGTYILPVTEKITVPTMAPITPLSNPYFPLYCDRICLF